MKHFRRITLVLSLLAAGTLACQTVMNLASPATPTRPVPTLAPVPTVPQEEQPTQPSAQGEPTLPPLAVPTQLQGIVPTQLQGLMPTMPSVQGLFGGATLSSPADTETALSNTTPPKTLEALATEKYSDKEMQLMNHTLPYTVKLSGEQPVLWMWGWCATTQDILTQNLQHIKLSFSMNAQAVSLDQFYAFDSPTTDSQGNTLQCHNWATVASNWPPAVELQTVATFDAKINDGMNDYAAGTQTDIYVVTRP
jgi:hypothetical protein